MVRVMKLEPLLSCAASKAVGKAELTWSLGSASARLHSFPLIHLRNPSPPQTWRGKRLAKGFISIETLKFGIQKRARADLLLQTSAEQGTNTARGWRFNAVTNYTNNVNRCGAVRFQPQENRFKVQFQSGCYGFCNLRSHCLHKLLCKGCGWSVCVCMTQLCRDSCGNCGSLETERRKELTSTPSGCAQRS